MKKLHLQKFFHWFRQVCMPMESNQFRPKALHTSSFILYGLSAMLFVGLSFAVETGKLSALLANLTQENIVSQVNPKRAEADKLPLKVHPKLEEAARLKAQDMVNRDYFSHTGPEGEEPWSWLDKTEYHYALAGENLAIDFADPNILVKAWLDSPSHAKNIYNGYFTDIGVGVASGEFQGRQTSVIVLFVGKEVTPTLQGLATANASQTPPPATTTPPAAPKPIKQQPTTVVKEPSVVVPPTELAVVQNIATEILEKENQLLMPKVDKEAFAPKQVDAFIASLEGFVLRFPKYARAGLTVFFGILLMWTLFTAIFHRKALFFFLSRATVLAVLTMFMWAF